MPFSKLLLTIRKLNNISRWSNEFLHRRASVAEHSFFVTQLAQLLGFIEEANGSKVNWELLYRKALNHDVPEALVGDVISTTKNLNADIKQTIKQVEEYMVGAYLTNPLPSPYKEYYEKALEEGKDASLEGRILTAADNIDALIECLMEICLSNTDPFMEKYFAILEKVKESPLVSVQFFLKDILPYLAGECKISLQA
jgi:putative hydrolase of HD superfamily